MFMEQFKRVQIILLETNNKSNIWSHKGRRLYYNQNNPNDVDDEIRYNIYIISEDEIKEGDWCMIIDKTSKLYGQFEQHKGKHQRNEQWKKIIATTDTSIKIFAGKGDICDLYYNLPQPSQQFIEEYIESYNKGNIITDVLVECKRVFETIAKGMIGHPEDDISWWNEKLKINPKDNTVTIKLNTVT